MDKKTSGDNYKLPRDKSNTKCKLTEMKLELGDVLLPSKSFKKLHIYKNQIVTYKCRSDDGVTICLGNEEHVIPEKDFCTSFVPAFCMTIDKSQGSGIDEKFAILETHMLKKNDFIVNNLYTFSETYPKPKQWLKYSNRKKIKLNDIYSSNFIGLSNLTIRTASLKKIINKYVFNKKNNK